MRKAVTALALVSLLILGACGGGGTDSTNTKDGEKPGAKSMEKPANCPETTTTVSLVATNTQFNTDCIAVEAGEAFKVTLENKDAFVHNVSFYKKEGAEAIQKGEPFTNANETHTYDFAAVAEGTWFFMCDVHPTMKGSLFAE